MRRVTRLAGAPARPPWTGFGLDAPDEKKSRRIESWFGGRGWAGFSAPALSKVV
jgi:hypothetical protein